MILLATLPGSNPDSFNVELGGALARYPAAPALPLSKFFTILASGISAEQGARIEPMLGPCRCYSDRGLARKFGALWTASMPKSTSLWNRREARDFLDSAVAVCRDNEHFTAKRFASPGDSYHNVVMELALLPMRDKVVCTPTPTNFLE
jgi:hypothetical protein